MRAQQSAALACVVVVIMHTGCRRSAVEPEIIRPVRAIKVGDLEAIQSREFPGRAQAKDEVDLSFQVSGPLISLPVDVGTEVKKGDVIASIDPRDFRAALDSAQGNLARSRANLLAMERGARPEEIEQLKASLVEAEASYRQALAEYERNEKMLPKGAVSKSDYDVSLARRDRTQAQIKTAQEELNMGLKGARPEDLEAKRAEIQALEAAVANAQNQLDYSVLKAPFDGRVAARYVDNFQTVQAKQSIVRLLDVSEIEVTIQVPESLIGLVPQVKRVLCRFDAVPGKDFVGHVTKIGSEATQSTRTYPVTVAVEQREDSQVLPGYAATVSRHPDDNDQGAAADLIVPPSAIFTASDRPETYVWVVGADQKVAQRLVKTGDLTPVGLVVTDGLQAGEWIVSAGVNSLEDQQEVTILQEGNR